MSKQIDRLARILYYWDDYGEGPYMFLEKKDKKRYERMAKAAIREMKKV